MWRKYALFRHVRQTCFAYNFFLCIFKKLLQQICNQHEILRFLTPSFDLKKFLGPISTFLNFETKLRKKRRQKIKNVLSKCVLDFKFCTHQRVCVLNYL